MGGSCEVGEALIWALRGFILGVRMHGFPSYEGFV